MGKTRAEIQKAYRQRLKEKDNEGYLQKEKERMRNKYVPSAQLSQKKRDRRNRLNRLRLHRFYEKKRAEREVNEMDESVSQTSGYETCEENGTAEESGSVTAEESGSVTAEESGSVTVEESGSNSTPGTSQSFPRIKYLPFNNRKNGPKKRWKRHLADAKSRIKELENEKEKAEKKLKAAQRNLQRFKKRIKDNEKTKEQTNEQTPSKRTEEMLNKANLTNEQREQVRKPLLLGNVLLDEIKETSQTTERSKKSTIYRVLSGKIMKKYKCVSLMNEKTGLCRKRLSEAKSRIQTGIKSRMGKRKRCEEKIIQFLEREDNSRTQPGKKDAKKVGSNKTQSYVLTDYLSNLYAKFKSENPGMNISFTTFTRTRPKYILTASFISRHTCLCTKHQNAALTAKALRRYGIIVPVNPEEMLKEERLKEKVREEIKDDTDIKLSQWKRVEIEEKGKKKYVTKIVESTLEKEEFVTKFENQIDEFGSHVERVSTQYSQIRTLKEKLPDHHMIIQMDFAENYSCRSLEEVQSAYFNQTTVTLHPMVVYYNDEDGALAHQSFIMVSDEMSHKSSTVLAFVEEIMPSLKLLDPDLDTIHYWTDSPTSQYRNKHMFEFVANHKDTYGVNARWNYFESGHGKGPCDGLGGTCKRLADEAMRSGRCVIQNAKDFYDWAVNSSMKNVKFRFVASHRCEEAATQLAQKDVKAIKGTMKVHCVVGMGDSKIKTRDVSCYCDICLTGNTCDGWTSESMKSKEQESTKTKEKSKQKESVTNTTEVQETSNEKRDDIHEFREGDFVAARYDRGWYVGKILDVDNDEDELEVTFMEKSKQLYKWPIHPDTLWIPMGDVLSKIEAPLATAKSKRMFAISESDKRAISDAINA